MCNIIFMLSLLLCRICFSFIVFYMILWVCCWFLQIGLSFCGCFVSFMRLNAFNFIYGIWDFQRLFNCRMFFIKKPHFQLKEDLDTKSSTKLYAKKLKIHQLIFHWKQKISQFYNKTCNWYFYRTIIDNSLKKHCIAKLRQFEVIYFFSFIRTTTMRALLMRQWAE